MDAETIPSRKRATKPKAPETLKQWPPPTLIAKHDGDDELISRAEEAIIRLLASDLEAKDMNAAIANAIRMIQVKNRIRPEGEPVDFWNSADD